MDRQLFRVCVAPGNGVVVREGAAVVVTAPQGDPQERFVDQLLRLLTDDASQLNAADGAIVRKVAALVTQAAAEDVPALGLVTSLGDDMVALLVGDMSVIITRADGEIEEASGRDATTLIETRIRGEFERILVSVAGESSTPDLRSNLTGGVVRGAGVLLVPAGIPAAQEVVEETLVDLALEVPDDLTEPSMNMAPDLVPEASFTSIPLFEPDGVSDELGESGEEPPAWPENAHPAPQVLGIVCSRGHFTNPEARFCSHCGISMVQQTHNLILGERPPIGVLVIDDGAVFSLNSDYIIGRESQLADAVVSGEAVALSLVDEGGAMSRVHARIVLDGWEVRVVDSNSANGTFVAETADSDWVRLEPGVPSTINPGTRLSMGGRTLTFESHQRL